MDRERALRAARQANDTEGIYRALDGIVEERVNSELSYAYLFVCDEIGRLSELPLFITPEERAHLERLEGYRDTLTSIPCIQHLFGKS